MGQVLVAVIHKKMGTFSVGFIKWNVSGDYELFPLKKIPQALDVLIQFFAGKGDILLVSRTASHTQEAQGKWMGAWTHSLTACCAPSLHQTLLVCTEGDVWVHAQAFLRHCDRRHVNV